VGQPAGAGADRKERKMIRNLKLLSLAFVAATALSAVAASGALAAVFHSEEAPTILFGSQHAGEDVITTDSGKVTCNEVGYAGIYEGTTTTQEVTLEPSFSECHLILIFTFNVTVDMNGCNYLFTAEQFVIGLTNDPPQVHLKCPTGKVIEVTAPSCTVTISPQTAQGIEYTNRGGIPNESRDITIDIEIKSLIYEEHGSACENETGITFNGTYNGAATIRAYNFIGNQQGFWYA
jgi:hypothetical protein